jgi:CheY-like chemotaxis protein
MNAEAMLETRALVIDDDPAMVEMLGLSLRKVVRRVDQETDCRRAIELFAAHKHSVVVLDLEMPQIRRYLDHVDRPFRVRRGSSLRYGGRVR